LFLNKAGMIYRLKLAGGLIKSVIRRRELYPKDIWNLKGIICVGADTSFYRERIEEYWGRKPLQLHGGTEAGMIATQTWDYDGMVVFPDSNFWEFISEDEYYKAKFNDGYQPATVLLNELKPGKKYELVITSFMGGAFIRYRTGDLIRVTGLRNEKLNINLPQIVYEDRFLDVINLAGFTRISEWTIWEALKKAGLKDANWIARKTFTGKKPVIELFIDWEQSENIKKTEEDIHNALCMINPDYRELEQIIGYRPLKLVGVPEKCISNYYENNKYAAQSHAPEKIVRIRPPEKLIKKIEALNLHIYSSGGLNR